jgi:multiple sugar transport system substrate-binding protein
MTGKTERSPSPSEVGFSLLGRRNFIVGAGAVVGTGALLAACGDDDDDDEGGSRADTTAAGTAAESPATSAASGGGEGEVTFGSNYSDAKPKEAMAAAIATSGLDVSINTVDHNTYQENFNTYIQQPDDVVCWFAGYRMRAFAAKGVVGDVSDVWANFSDMSEGFKNASTALDGKQYFVPFYFYPWAVHYRKSMFEENGYEIPATWDDFLALLEQMKTDGIATPIAAANDGKWPQMGMFDMINMRTNGYDFHVALMGGKESWTDDRVKAVFTAWKELLPYYMPDANGRTWQDAATALADGEAGVYLLGTFITSNFDETQQDIIDDIDFFAFPSISDEFGQESVEAPIDGFMMAASPENPDGAKALLTALGGAPAIDAYIAIDPSVVAANASAKTDGYNALQQKSAELVGSATYISQFLDRDTDPDFAANVVGTALADFLSNPDSIDNILSTVEEQKATYTFE